MCRMTDTGVRGRDAIDSDGLWYISPGRSHLIYLLDTKGDTDMSAFKPAYRVRVKGRAGE